MIRMIRADLRRILGKKILIVIFVIALAFTTFRLVGAYSDYSIPYVAVESVIKSLSLVNAVLGLLIFFAVYADDFKSMSYVTAIGRGIFRDKVVLAKLWDVVIMSFVMYGIFALVLTGYCAAAGCTFNHTLSKAWWMTFFISCYKNFGYVALTSMILFITNNVPLGTICLMILYLAVPLSGMILGLNDAIAKLHIERIHFAGLADNAMADIMFGMNIAAIIKLLFGLLVYTGIVILVTRILFNKKELDF